MPLSWKPLSLTSWAADDAKYTYIAYLTAAGTYGGVIRPRGSNETLFSASYLTAGAAKADLESRGREDYFVMPEDVNLTPPPQPGSEPLPEPEPTPAEDPSSGDESVPGEQIELPVYLPDPNAPSDPPVPPRGTFEGHTVELYIDRRGEYRWRRKAANYKNISNGSEGYTTRAACEHGLRLANQDTNYTLVDLTKEKK